MTRLLFWWSVVEQANSAKTETLLRAPRRSAKGVAGFHCFSRLNTTALLIFTLALSLPALGAPNLKINYTNSQVVLSWTEPGFVIQSAPVVNSSVTWTNSGVAVTTNQSVYSATFSPSGSRTFFRLITATSLPAGPMLVPETSSFYVNWDAVPPGAACNLYLAESSAVQPTNYASLPGGQLFSGVTLPYYINGLVAGRRYYLVITSTNLAGAPIQSPTVTEIFGPHAQVSGSVYMNIQTSPGVTNLVAMPGAWVWLTNTTNGAATVPVPSDVNGQFVIPAQPAGSYAVCYALSNAVFSCGTVCLPQSIVLNHDAVTLAPIILSDSCQVLYGSVILNDGAALFQEIDPFLGINITALARLVDVLGHTNLTQINQAGEFVFIGVAPGSYSLYINCQGAQSSQAITMPSPTPIVLALPNTHPRILSAYAQDAATGQPLVRANPGQVVRLTVAATDPDGDALSYHWVPGLSDVAFQSVNSPSVLWQLPFGSGMHVMYFTVSDNKGGVATGKIAVSTDPTALFTGSVLQSGLPPVNPTFVAINGQTVACGSSGYFSIAVTNPTPPYVMTIQSQGCEPYSQVFSEPVVDGTYSLYESVVVTFLPLGTSIITGNQIVIVFTSGSVVDQFGAPYTQPVTATFSGFDPGGASGRLPGSPNGIGPGGTNYSLTVFAGANLTLATQTGQPLYINPLNPPQISVPVGSFQTQTTVAYEVWVYNPTNGLYSFLTSGVNQSGTNSIMWPILKTGTTVCAVSALATNTSCVTLEINNSIDLPVDVLVRRPTTQVKKITQRFTTFNDLPPNQNVSFEIFQANEITLTNSCVISNSVNTGPANPFSAQSSNCVSVALTFPGIPTPDKLLAFKFGPGTPEYAEAYYKAIDPANAKTTFADWKAANGFNPAPDAEAIYFNNGDLGFGRWMGMKTNANGDIAYYVSNYGSADAAITARAGSQTNGLGATVCMEYSAAPNNPGHRFTKFYIFDEANKRVGGVELDGRGVKYLPNLCLVCHGGKRPPEAAQIGSGDMEANFLPFDQESFRYSKNPAFTQAAQAESFKRLNATTLRAAATTSISNLVEGWYGGPTLPGNYNKEYAPAGWTGTPAQRYLYDNVYKVSCRSCHIARTETQPDFLTFETFNTDKIARTICGPNPTMPNALRTFNIFWASRCSAIDQPQILKTNLDLACPP